jgi:hypothetical protein
MAGLRFISNVVATLADCEPTLTALTSVPTTAACYQQPSSPLRGGFVEWNDG